MSEAALHATPGGTGIGSASLARLVALLLPLSLLTAAYGSEYLGGLVPCEMCWWQRYAHFAALPLAVLAFTASSDSSPARALTLMAALAIAVSGAIGGYHAGVELGIFEGITTCSSSNAGASADELLSSIMKTPLVRCDQVQWSFLGISMAGWNAIISLGGAALILALTFKARRA